ncbi:MHS family MFS transporter [Ferruginibacter lapsinanis]|uniref:MFS transporter n=1 Tax=Ferruginibacter lapsinanis TaxID=563172 RepID=UPI001E60A9A9|nr:MFS transporter [Ferruginibacter lapsinanis]UEG50512.1 MHS family MFS transporter [Ferruginibacter lapsinanis]
MADTSTKGIGKVIFSSSLGTLIEWYDFYIFGMLAKTISVQFFPEGNETAALLSTLAIFAAGFLVRPFGALFFGRLGDLIGRKSTFLLTLVLMGGSTFLIGLVPSYKAIGIAAPLLVLLLRLIQGLALGGEYGGAATYVAEHAPANRRGYFTAWIQTTATLGLFVALGVIMVVKSNMSDAAFTAEWGGWRYPFWISILLVGVSIYIRLKMSESPLYAAIKKEGKLSVNPLKESFGHKGNFKMVLLALFGAVMGQGVIWYTGQFYAQSFLENTCKLEFMQSRSILLWAIALATPFFLFFGWLSDKIGRKWIMLTGMLLGVLFYRPIFDTFLKDTDIKKWTKTEYSFIKEEMKVSMHGEDSVLQISAQYQTPDQSKFTRVVTDTLYKNRDELQHIVNVNKNAVFINKEINSTTYYKFIFLVWIMVIFVTMVYGPIAAFLVELFPTKIRYTSMSLPYHIGNGVFGGLVPFLATLLSTTFVNDPLVGLWYPIGVAALCFVVGALYLNNKIDEDVND